MSPVQGVIDSHCHLQDPKFDGQHEAVVRRAREAGVSDLVVVGYDLESSRRAVELTRSFASVYATVGIHPHDAKTLTPSGVDALARLAEDPSVVAIGEIGLDFYRNLSSPDRQRQAFREQLSLARSRHLPVVIHARDADNEAFDILSLYPASVKPEWVTNRPLGVMHCFAGDLPLALRYVELGFLISIAGTITYHNAAKMRAVARDIPLESIVVETDAPYLTPQSRRGQRNEPAYIVETARFIAELRSEPFGVIAQMTSVNAARLFALDLVPQPAGERP
ncbi:MAG: TatD family deoxyribonuclease [Chloroflexi bacterium]|nr:MAG: TatD family deoxyribonuclease [Chloroflexota bacterium]